MAEIQKTINFLIQRIDQNKNLKERMKITAYYTQALVYVQMQVHKTVHKSASRYSPYKCPVCSTKVYEDYKYCCECGNKLRFEE